MACRAGCRARWCSPDLTLTLTLTLTRTRTRTLTLALAIKVVLPIGKAVCFLARMEGDSGDVQHWRCDKPLPPGLVLHQTVAPR